MSTLATHVQENVWLNHHSLPVSTGVRTVSIFRYIENILLEIFLNICILQLNNSDREVLVISSSLCRILADVETQRDIVWSSSDCQVSWASLGAWCERGGCVNTVSRSHEGRLLAVGDDTGHVSLYPQPASRPTCGRHVYPGHSCEVSKVTFLADDTRLVTIGGKDCAIMQWEVE